MKRSPVFWLLPALCVLVVSCGKNECRDNTPFVHFSGFDSTELSGMVRKRYKRTPDFATYVATDSSHLLPAPSLKDNFLVSDWSRTTDTRYLDPAYNYVVEVPATGKTYRIRDIYFDARTEKAGGATSQVDRCCNTVHFTVNESLFTYTPPPESERFDIVLYR